MLPHVHLRPARHHRQPGRRRRRCRCRRPTVVRHDGDDTYLVVAADKGTATFSDIANAVAADYGFWLGDAFASGGSAGYDHKAMGITARGAWESVKRHFRELGVDTADRGLHRGRHRRHVRRRVRQRDAAVGAHPAGRRVRPPARLPRPRPRPGGELRRAPSGCSTCRAPPGPTTTRPDLGGWRRLPADGEVDPAVRAGQEAAGHRRLRDVDVALRADARDPAGTGRPAVERRHRNLRQGEPRVPRRRRRQGQRRDPGQRRSCAPGSSGEGGNLGLTQLGRIEYALAGGRINTDAIDNSAGRRHLRPRGQHQDPARPARARG